MDIRGLGENKKPFIYLDEYINSDVDWQGLHNEISYGIAKSEWSKRYVSSGVHPAWAHLEITPLMRKAEYVLSTEQKLLMQKLQTTDEKLKFMAALKHVPHPFWLIYLRNNKRIFDSISHFPLIYILIESTIASIIFWIHVYVRSIFNSSHQFNYYF
jgi:hypothetical protein